MSRTHGYAPKGQRCIGGEDWGKKERTNVIGALTYGKLKTLSLFQFSIDTKVFTTWLIQDLLLKLDPGR
jgi:hypothetical protein